MNDTNKAAVTAAIDAIDKLIVDLKAGIDTDKLLDGDRAMNRLATVVKRSNRYRRTLTRLINPPAKKVTKAK